MSGLFTALFPVPRIWPHICSRFVVWIVNAKYIFANWVLPGVHTSPTTQALPHFELMSPTVLPRTPLDIKCICCEDVAFPGLQNSCLSKHLTMTSDFYLNPLTTVFWMNPFGFSVIFGHLNCHQEGSLRVFQDERKSHVSVMWLQMTQSIPVPLRFPYGQTDTFSTLRISALIWLYIYMS